MATRVQYIRGLASSPDRDVIRLLETLLADAKAGKLIGFAGVGEYPGQWRALVAGAVVNDCGPYIGWLTILQHEMISATKRETTRNRVDVEDEDDGNDGDGDGNQHN